MLFPKAMKLLYRNYHTTAVRAVYRRTNIIATPPPPEKHMSMLLPCIRRLFSTYRYTNITTNIPPPETLCNELNLIVNQDPFDVTIHGLWRAILEELLDRNGKKYQDVKYLINEPPDYDDFIKAELELEGLDPAILHKLESMWQKPSGNYKRREFMEDEFVKHSYFEETFSLASRYLCANGGIKAFLLNEFKPGVKYSPKYVKWMLKSFVGADTKIRYRGELPPTLGEIGILVDETDGQIINHPDRDFVGKVDMYVIKEQA